MTARLATTWVLVFVATFVFFVLTSSGQRLDNRIWTWTTGSFDRALQADISFAVRRVMPGVAAAILLLHSLIRRSWRTLFVGLVAWALSTGAAFLLREALVRPTLGDNGGKPVNSFPSTHVALAATPLVLLLVWGSVRRELQLVYGLVVAGVVLGNTMLLVHRFSDGVGAVALAAAIGTITGSIGLCHNRGQARHNCQR